MFYDVYLENIKYVCYRLYYNNNLGCYIICFEEIKYFFIC